jgi:multidrug transporter EmrE-like cation transporter
MLSCPGFFHICPACDSARRKDTLIDMETLLRSTLFNAVMLAALLAFSHGIMKWVALRAKGSFTDLILDHWMPLGFAVGIYIFLFLYYTQVLRSTDLNMLYPVYGGLSILFVFAIGTWFFAEPTNILKILGCALIACGIFLVTK